MVEMAGMGGMEGKGTMAVMEGLERTVKEDLLGKLIPL
jgi:hypothetical protein